MGWNGRAFPKPSTHALHALERRLANVSRKAFRSQASRESETKQAYPISIGGEHACGWLRLLLPAWRDEKSEAVGREALSREGILTKAWGRRGAERDGETGEGKAWAKVVAERTSIPVA